jgi:thiol:disulfide interchange protein DsbA
MRKILLAVSSTILLTNVFASPLPIQEGTDYTVLSGITKPLPQKAGKINVTEFFSYACIHCSILEPSLEQWSAKTKNIDLNRIQVVWDNHFIGYAKINASIQLLNLGSAFNLKVFDATMKQRQDLEDPKTLKAFLTANKNLVEPNKFMATYNSFSVSTKPQEYADYTQSYNITGTPTFVVANKYMTTPAQPEKLIQVIDALVAKAKKEQKIK